MDSDEVALFTQLVNVLHPDDVVNCLLVVNKLRPAYMIQCVDRHRLDRNLKSDVSNIKNFAKLHTKTIDQGILVSKTQITDEMFDPDSYTDSELGMLLGYPCHDDFRYHINKDSSDTSVNLLSGHLQVVVKIKTDNIRIDETVEIMSNVLLEKNREVFISGLNDIISYIQSLNLILRKSFGEGSITLKPIVQFHHIYNPKQIVESYVLHFNQKYRQSDRVPINSLIYEVLNLLENYSYGLLSVLHKEGKISILNPDLFNVVYDCLDNIVKNGTTLLGMVYDSIKELVDKNNRCIISSIKISHQTVVISEDDIKKTYLLYNIR